MFALNPSRRRRLRRVHRDFDAISDWIAEKKVELEEKTTENEVLTKKLEQKKRSEAMKVAEISALRAENASLKKALMNVVETPIRRRKTIDDDPENEEDMEKEGGKDEEGAGRGRMRLRARSHQTSPVTKPLLRFRHGQN